MQDAFDVLILGVLHFFLLYRRQPVGDAGLVEPKNDKLCDIRPPLRGLVVQSEPRLALES
jgi:hypothetical protein